MIIKRTILLEYDSGQNDPNRTLTFMTREDIQLFRGNILSSYGTIITSLIRLCTYLHSQCIYESIFKFGPVNVALNAVFKIFTSQ